MEIRVLADADAVALEGARVIAAAIRDAAAARGRAVVALSGGRTPWMMLRALVHQDVPWHDVHLLQVDERFAPAGDADRNLTHIHTTLLRAVPEAARQVHAMPVEAADPDAAVRAYADTLVRVAGDPATLDLVHLGLGADGHTASLVPGDPVLDVADRDVAVTRPYHGRLRMTLTYPVLDRARRVLWIVTGADKAAMLARLVAADAAIPAGRVRQERALVLADRVAAGQS
jgi:6-phosphogluconolactonase